MTGIAKLLPALAALWFAAAPPPPPAPPPASKSATQPGLPPAPPPASKSGPPAPPAPGTPPTAKGAAPASKPAPQPTGEESTCYQCHTDPDLWSGPTQHLYVPKENLTRDAHWQHQVRCTDCHGGDPATDQVNQAHAKENKFRALDEVRKGCGGCHKQEAFGIDAGVHATAVQGPSDTWTPLGCFDCHGKYSHRLLPVKNPASPVFAVHQVETCGRCHAEHRQSYAESHHGRGLYAAGLSASAVCADCHGAHGVYRMADDRSTLSWDSVPTTCGKCHSGIDERLQRSVHRRTPTEPRKAPVCTSCHRGHTPAPTGAPQERMQWAAACGNCHLRATTGYATVGHTELTTVGYVPAAKCSDCHGVHEVLPASDPGSRLSEENRAATCRQCHLQAVGNFLTFNPHADYTNPQRYPAVATAYTALLTVLLVTFGLFLAHCVVWFIRGLIEVLLHGRRKGMVAGGPAYVRFDEFYRITHMLLMLALFVLALTGLPMRYSHRDWAASLAEVLGGFPTVGIWHRLAGLVAFACLLAYVVRFVQRLGRREPVRRLVFGPDSPVPSLRDVLDFGRMVRWFAGIGKRPTFERWTYWEKFDFWAVWGNVLILGLTGLALWFPNAACGWLPPETLNVAKVIHSYQALLATGFLFAVHLFNAHLRPARFPGDLSMTTGLIGAERMERERPEYLERLQREGRLEQVRARAPSRFGLWFARGLNLLALGVGLALLIGMALAGLSE